MKRGLTTFSLTMHSFSALAITALASTSLFYAMGCSQAVDDGDDQSEVVSDESANLSSQPCDMCAGLPTKHQSNGVHYPDNADYRFSNGQTCGDIYLQAYETKTGTTCQSSPYRKPCCLAANRPSGTPTTPTPSCTPNISGPNASGSICANNKAPTNPSGQVAIVGYNHNTSVSCKVANAEAHCGLFPANILNAAHYNAGIQSTCGCGK